VQQEHVNLLLYCCNLHNQYIQRLQRSVVRDSISKNKNNQMSSSDMSSLPDLTIATLMFWRYF